MSSLDLLQEISQKETDKNEIVDRAIRDPELIPEIIEGLGARKARTKYGCAKVLRLLSEKKPETLYPWFDLFTDMLESENSFLKWDAIHILGNLAAVDTENRFEKAYDKYFAPIPGPVLITAANVIGGAAKIALAKPALTEKVTKEILKVEKARYQTDECRNVALGQAIESFDLFFDQIEDKRPVVALVRRQLDNTRNSTRKKAQKFLKKWG
ncbi:MAG TPA: hypothetical protein G4O18_05105 [Dehalococcoidia bacterium]|nr:hypothetical protein [Dehalococcoidia bacterium]